MKEIQLLESITGKKVVLKEGRVSDKDWERMLDLVLTNKDGDGVAATINDKDKAIARFVAGNKLSGNNIKWEGSYWSGEFRAFGDKAIRLGATPEEIQNVFDTTEVPQKYSDKQSSLGSSDKKLDNRFVGSIAKFILALGHDISFLKTNGNAITRAGVEAMSRNGIKWTIGYRAEVTLSNGKKVNLIFDAITDEGDGPTKYITDQSTDIAKHMYTPVGKREFLEKIKGSIDKLTTVETN